MTKKLFSKALALLATVCITAGCDGGAATETTTSAGTSVIIETEENLNEKEYCEIPDGMTFEDLCGLFYYNDVQLKFPCTLNEILALDEEFELDLYGVEYEDMETVYEIASLEKCDYDEKGMILNTILLGTIQGGDLNSYEDISAEFSFNLAASDSQRYSLYYDVLSFNGIHYGDDFSSVKEFLGEPNYEGTGYCIYYFEDNGKEIIFEFTLTKDGGFNDACFGYYVKED